MPLQLIEGQYAPGDPICPELSTDDRASAQAFYSELFDWTFEEVEGRTRALKADRMAAGIGLMEGLDLAGPRWWICLAAPDLEDLVDRVEPSGAISRPMGLEGLGRAAVLEDPAGAKAVLWQPDRLEPGALGATHGGLVWSDLVVDDPSGVAGFYERLFDLEAAPVDDRSTSQGRATIGLVRRELEVPRMVVGIISASESSSSAEVGARWRPYFQVDDLEEFLRAAERTGASVSETRTSASRRAFAVLSDPQGAEFGVVAAGPG